MYLCTEWCLQRCGRRSPRVCVCVLVCAQRLLAAAGRGTGVRSWMSGSWVPPVCVTAYPRSRPSAASLQSRLRPWGCARPKERGNSRVCVGIPAALPPSGKGGWQDLCGASNEERAVSAGSSLQRHLGTVSGEGARGMCFFRSRQRSAPMARMVPPGQDTCFLLAKLEKPLQLQPPDKV